MRLYMAWLALFLAMPSARAADWYVSPTGEDGTGKGTLESPWRSVGFALENAAAGDHVVLLDDGDAATPDFKETISISETLPGLVLQRFDDDDSPPMITPTGGPTTIQVWADDVVVSRLDIVPHKSGGAVKFESFTTGGRVEGCTIHGQAGEPGLYGIILSNGSTDHVVSGNQVSGVSDTGLLVLGTGHVLTGNELVDCASGITMKDGAYGLIAGNVVTGFTGAGIAVTPSLPSPYSAAFLLGNTVSGGKGDALKLQCSQCLVAGNVISGNAGAAFSFLSGGNFLFFNDLSDNGGGPVAAKDKVNTWTTPMEVAWRVAGNTFKGLPGSFYGGLYSGSDDGSGTGIAGDGIGDTALPVVTDGQGDSHPLTQPLSQYEPLAWLLAPDGLLYPAASALTADGLEGLGAGNIVLLPSQTAVFAAKEPAEELLVFPAGEPSEGTAWTWHMQFQIKGEKPGGYLARMGWVDPDGEFRFGPDGPAQAFDPAAAENISTGTLAPAWLVIPEGGRLAFTLTNQYSAGKTVLLPWASFVSPSVPGTPPYPKSGLAAPAALSVAPDALDLGDVGIGEFSQGTVLLENTSAAPLTVDKVFLAGQHAEQLELPETGCLEAGTPFTLAAGQSCELAVGLYASSGGPKFAAVMIQSDDAAAPLVPVGVTAQAGPQHVLSVLADPAGLGLVNGPGIWCPDDCDQAFDPDTAVSLQAAPGDGNGFVSWEGCDAAKGPKCDVTMTGDRQVVAHFKTLAPVLVADPLELAFGTVEEGQTSEAQLVEIHNEGDALADLGELTIQGADAADFALKDDACSKTALPPGSSCTVSVVFSPGSGGDKSGSLVIPTTGLLPAELTVALTGNAQAFQRSLTVVVSPPEGGTVTGEGISCPGDCTETWPGPMQVTLQAEAAEGFGLSSFVGCMPSEASCQLDVGKDSVVTVTFVPNAPALAVKPDLLAFGKVAPGGDSESLPLTAVNGGTAALTVKSVELQGMLAEEFRIDSNGCSNTTLQPNDECKVYVTFRPDAAGVRAATLLVTTLEPLPPVPVGMYGIGAGEPVEPTDEPDVVEGGEVASEGPTVSVSPEIVEFGTNGVGERSAPVDVNVSNTGTGILELWAVQFEGWPGEGEEYKEGEFEILYQDCDDAKLEPGEQCVIRLVHTPAGNGSRGAQLYMGTSDPARPIVTVILHGTGGSTDTGGCSMAGSTTMSGARNDGTTPSRGMILLLALGLALGVLRLRRTGIMSGVLRLRRLQGTALLLLCAMPLLTSCIDAIDPCDGEMNLSVEDYGNVNALNPINSVDKWMCSAESYGCHEVVFTCFESPQASSYVRGIETNFSFTLQPPLFLGRVFGPGLELIYLRKGNLVPEQHVMVAGTVTITQVDVHEKGLVCTDNITLEIDGDFGSLEGELANWANPPPILTHLEGSIQYSYGGPGWSYSLSETSDTVITSGCLPPQVETSSSDRHLGWAYMQSALSLEIDLPGEVHDCPADAGACCGSDVNRVTGHDSRWVSLDNSGKDKVTESVFAEVEPPEFLMGNYVCDPASFPAPPAACPIWRLPEPFAVELPVTLLGRYGPLPSALTQSWRDEKPVFQDVAILAPSPHAALSPLQPLTVQWTVPDGGATKNVRLALHGTAAQSTVPSFETPGPQYFELDVPDTGEAMLDAAFLVPFEGEAKLSLSRVTEVPLVSECPFAEGSNVIVERGREVPVQIEVLP